MPKGGKAKGAAVRATTSRQSGPHPLHATFDGDCENCGGTFEIGDWVMAMVEEDYEFFVHELCPAVPDTMDDGS